MRLMYTLMLASTAGFALPAPGIAQTVTGDPAAGLQLVRQWCSNCHAVEPMRQPQSSDTAPSFVAVANAPTTTAMGLHAFLQTPHGQMPDFRLTRGQIEDITAYVLSLRQN